MHSMLLTENPMLTFGALSVKLSKVVNQDCVIPNNCRIIMLRLLTARFLVSKVVKVNNTLAREGLKLQRSLKNVRQTAGQAQQLQKYVKSKSKEEIAGKIDQMARNQEELRDYINKFNQDHNNRINILDVSNYARGFKDLNQPGLKSHELELLDEFRKRRRDIRGQQLLRKALKQAEKLPEVDDFEEVLRDADFDEQMSKFVMEEPSIEQEDETANQVDDTIDLDKYIGQDQSGTLNASTIQFTTVKNEGTQNDSRIKGFRQGAFEIHDRFICLILHRDSTTKVTTLNRINTSRTIVFMGNGTGLMAYGRGRAKSYKEALRRAIIQCRKNIIAVPLDPTMCVPQPLYAHFQDYKISLRPAREFNPWGHPVFATMLSTAGIFDCGFKTVHTGKNHYNVVNGLFKVATKNKTPQQISEKEGRKIYRKQWLKPIPFKAASSDKAILD